MEINLCRFVPVGCFLQRKEKFYFYIGSFSKIGITCDFHSHIASSSLVRTKLAGIVQLVKLFPCKKSFLVQIQISALGNANSM